MKKSLVFIVFFFKVHSFSHFGVFIRIDFVAGSMSWLNEFSLFFILKHQFLCLIMTSAIHKVLLIMPIFFDLVQLSTKFFHLFQPQDLSSFFNYNCQGFLFLTFLLSLLSSQYILLLIVLLLVSR